MSPALNFSATALMATLGRLNATSLSPYSRTPFDVLLFHLPPTSPPSTIVTMNPDTIDKQSEYLYDAICEVGNHLVVSVITDYMGRRDYCLKNGDVGQDQKVLLLEHLGECLHKGVVLIRKMLNENTLVPSAQGPVLVPIKEVYGLVCRDGEVLGLAKEGLRHLALMHADKDTPAASQYDIEYCSWGA